MTALMEVRELTVRHGGVLALDAVSMQVESGEVVGLIGPNGAGKTTFIDTVTGYTAAHRGAVLFAGRDVTTTRPHRRARAGLVRTFQSVELFDDLTVEDNVLVAAHTPTVWSTLTDVLWPKSHHTEAVGRALDMLGITGLAPRLPGELSAGQRQLVSLARAVVASPKLVLLDEPAAGLDPDETEQLVGHLRALADDGTTVVVVDHDMSLIMNACGRVDVLDVGRIVASGPPDAIRNDPAVIEAYLGSGGHS